MKDTQASNIYKWVRQGIAEGARYVLDVHDIFDNDHYPVFAKDEKELDEAKEKYNGNNMQQVYSVFDIYKEMDKALFYDDLESGEGCVVRHKLSPILAIMNDGQIFNYNYSVAMNKMTCPVCKNNDSLVFKGDEPDLVEEGKIGHCKHCGGSFTLDELIIREKKTLTIS